VIGKTTVIFKIHSKGAKVMAYIEVKNEFKRYHVGETVITANNGVSFEIEKGEFVVILGPSGAGKSTVLNILGGMDTCDEGEIIVDGVDIAKFNSRQLTEYRRLDVGFVFQFYNLVPNLTAKENVELAAQIVPNAKNAEDVLKSVGLGDRMDNFIAQLSGGEQQRVTIARAIAKNPKLLLCDEPTGALDSDTGKKILQLLQDVSRETGTTVVVITHNTMIAPIADRVIRINDAKVRSEQLNEHPVDVSEIEW
jgi:putative ABC transport system ATP-binding protein